ncbi:MAG: agmatine deiminase family protein [Prevotella sp.]|nr:agmatine deiminase family protein [Prevotella sp.]
MNRDEQTNRWRLPAEWEPQSGVQLTWPHAGTDWAPMLADITATYRETAREIARRERLLIVAQEIPGFPEIPEDNATIVSIPTDDTWARDHGFITLVDDQGGIRLLDFHFNGWGEKFPASNDNAINRQLLGVLHGDYESHLDFVLEGGAIESDGRGTIFTTSCCLLAPHRNQPLSREEIAEQLKTCLCAKRIVWIDHGSLTGDDTDGHIDTLIRICPDDTLLYVGCDTPEDEQYEGLQLMEQQLQTLRTLDGHPYRLRKLPMPRPIFDEGERLPATYANFLVVNGAVLCPTYAQPDLDAEALRIIGEAFPGREIVGFDCRSVIRQHGSLHCCTMQFPQGAMKEKPDKPNNPDIPDFPSKTD